MTHKNACIIVLSVLQTFPFQFISAAETSMSTEPKQKIIISSLPDNIKLIIGESKDQFYAPRVKAIHELPNNMSQDQIEACFDFLEINRNK